MKKSKLKGQSSREGATTKLQGGWGTGHLWSLVLGTLIFLGALSFDLCASELPACCRKTVTNSAPTDKSLYQLESNWTSDFGKTIRLGVLRGRPVVLALFFTKCEFACPIIVHDLQRLAAALPEASRGKVDFVLVSLDTERDTVEALHAYRARQDLPAANWLLLRGAADDLRELAALLGVNYQKDARGQFAHSNLITVLNPEGEVAHQLVGLNQPVADTAKVLQRLLPP